MRIKSSILRFPFFLFLFVLFFVVNGCQEDLSEKVDESDTTTVDLTFTDPVFSGGRQLDTLFAIDLDDDGLHEYVVTSIQRRPAVPTTARADQVEIYRFDTADGAWKPELTDTLLWTTEYALKELTGDRASELVVKTFGGGNDLVSSSGLVVYSGHGKSVRKLLEQEDGAPRVEQIEGASLPIILLHSEFWPKFVPHVEATTYVSDLLSLADGRVQSVREENIPFFRKKADQSLRNYRESLKEAIPFDTLAAELGDEGIGGSPLYIHAAETIIALNQVGEKKRLQSFWYEEEERLRGLLSEEEFDVLQELYAENIMQ